MTIADDIILGNSLFVVCGNLEKTCETFEYTCIIIFLHFLKNSDFSTGFMIL